MTKVRSKNPGASSNDGGAALEPAVKHSKGGKAHKPKKPPASKARPRFLAPARAEGRRVDAFISAYEQAAGDGSINKAEHKDLEGLVAQAEDGANALVATQGKAANPVLALMNKFAKTGKLHLAVSDAVSSLLATKVNILKQARSDALHDPLARFSKQGYSTPYPGMRMKVIKYDGVTTHVLVADLADPKVRLQINSYNQRGNTVGGDVMSQKSAVFGINGDWFAWSTHNPTGRAMSNGQIWKSTDKPWEHSIGFYGQHAEMFGPYSTAPWEDNILSGRPTVLENGNLYNDPSSRNGVAGSNDARTGVGLSANGRVLYIVANDRKVNYGLTARQFGHLFQSLGAYNAMSMDTGGSAQLYQRGHGYLQASTDGHPRPVSDVLMLDAV